MTGSEELNTIVDKIMAIAGKHPGIDEVEAYASHNVITMARLETLRHGHTKFGPFPQQLKSLGSTEASVRVVVNKAVGSFGTNYFSDKALEGAVEQALRSAKRMDPDPNFRSLAKPIGAKPSTLPHDNEIASGDVSDPLVDSVEAAVSMVDKDHLDIAGSVMAVLERYASRNSHGITVENSTDTFVVAQLTAEWVDGADVISSGMGWSSSRFMKNLNSTNAATDALELARLKPVHKSIPAGDYSIILGPYAVGDVIDNLFNSAFSLDSIYYGSSWLPKEMKTNTQGKEMWHPKLGEKIADERVTLRDDPTLPDGMASKALDDEGLATNPKTLVDKGVWKEVLADSYHSYLYDLAPCGSGFRSSYIPGRIAGATPSGGATNLILEPGDMKFQELLEVTKGPTLMIPRTWYTYPIRSGAPAFSSSNRSTAFLVEGGELVPVAPNAFKFMGNIETILNNIHGIGSETKSATSWAASTASIVPHLSASGFRVEKQV